MSAPTAPRREDRFVAFLRSLRERGDRGALATLRRGRGARDALSTAAYPYVAPWLPSDAPRWTEECYFAVAAFLAAEAPTQQSEPAENFGASLALLAARGRGAGVERRLVAALGAHRDDVLQHVRQLASLLRSQDVATNWAQLLRDLLAWGREDRAVQRAWARAFWSADREDDQEPASDAGFEHE